MTTYSESYWKRREEADEARDQSPFGMLDKLSKAEPVEDLEPAVRKLPAGASSAPDIQRLQPVGAANPEKPPEMQLLASKGEPKESPPPPSPLTTAEKPVFGPVEPPPEALEPETDWAGYEPEKVQTSAPSAPSNRDARLQAVREAQKLASSPVDTGISDGDIAEVQGRDRDQKRKDAFTEAIQAWMQRRPVRFGNPTEGDDLVQRRQLAEGSAFKQRDQQLTAAQQLARALSGHEPDPSLAERRLALTEEAKNRSKLSQAQLEALERERARKGGMEERKLDETERYHQGLLDAKKKPVAKGPPVKITAGNIETVPERKPGYRNVIKAIADGRIEAPKAAARFGAEVVSDVLAYKPDFDATRFGNYAAVSKAQATGKDKMAIKVAREHLATAKRLIPANYDTRMLNRVKQAYVSGSGAQDLAPFETAVLVAAHEVARVYGIEDQTGKQLIEHLLDPTQSPQQLRARLETTDELIAGKERGLEEQLGDVAPARQTGAPQSGGKVKVSNGKEELLIDPADLAEAEAEGFKAVK